MSSAFFIGPSESCPGCAKVQYAEKSFFKRHLTLNHDFSELFQFALDKGLIQDPIKYHNRNSVLNRIVEYCKVELE